MLLARPLQTGQQRSMIHPPLAREIRQLLRRIVRLRERADLVNAAREGPV